MTDLMPAMFKIPDAVAYSGLSRSRIFLAIKDGQIDARKAGKALLIRRESLDAFLACLPRA